MLFSDENTNEGVAEVLHEIQNYVPCYGEEEDKVYAGQGVVADQLSVECGVNCLLQVANGLTAKERMDGIHLEVADFHTKMKFLQVCNFLVICSQKRNMATGMGGALFVSFSTCTQFLYIESIAVYIPFPISLLNI